MDAVPISVVNVKVSSGWIAYVRYADKSKDQDIAANSKYMLDRRVDYLFRPLMRRTDG